MQLHLKKFDISKLSDDSVVVFIGKRRTGKSFLLKDLLYHHKDIPIGTVISATESANRFYGDIIPDLFIHDEYSAEVIGNFLKRQKKIKMKINRQKEEKGYSDIDPRAFLILDDCMYDNKSWANDKNIKCLFMNGRHYHVLFCITMQYPLGIHPNLRTNIDYIFILREQITQNRRRIYDCYAGMFPTYESFASTMDACTENYECLVINVNAQSNKLEDQVFWYKAEHHDNFKIGAKEFWQIHKNNYNNKHDEEEEDMFDINALKRKKNQPLLKVKKNPFV